MELLSQRVLLLVLPPVQVLLVVQVLRVVLLPVLRVVLLVPVVLVLHPVLHPVLQLVLLLMSRDGLQAVQALILRIGLPVLLSALVH